jgi:galactitol-specific phosphotransferase system IIB component
MGRRLYFPSDGSRAIRIFIAIKNPSSSAGSEPTNLASNGKHDNQQTTKGECAKIVCVQEVHSSSLVQRADILTKHAISMALKSFQVNKVKCYTASYDRFVSHAHPDLSFTMIQWRFTSYVDKIEKRFEKSKTKAKTQLSS